MDETPAQQVDSPSERAEEDRKRSSRAGWVWATVVVLAIAALCGFVSIRANSSGGADEPAVQQASTCGDWSTEAEADKMAQAREMLTALRRADGLDAPGTEMAQRFAGGITNVCSANPGWKLSEIAASLYLTERATFG